MKSEIKKAMGSAPRIVEVTNSKITQTVFQEIDGDHD